MSLSECVATTHPFLSSSSVHCCEVGGMCAHDGGCHDDETDIVVVLFEIFFYLQPQRMRPGGLLEESNTIDCPPTPRVQGKRYDRRRESTEDGGGGRA